MSHGRLAIRSACAGLTAFACSLFLASGAAGFTWSEPLAVSPTTQYAEEPNIAIDEGGDAVVVWRQRINAYESAIWVSVKPAGGTYSAPIELLNGPGQNQEPEVALGPAGEVIVAWGSEDRTRKIEGERLMFSKGSVVTGVFSAPQAIAKDSVGGGGLPLDIGIDGHGEALVVWQGMADNFLYATRAPGAQAFSAPVEISNPGLSIDRPDIAIAHDGAAVVAWTGSVEKRTNGKSWTGAFAAVREPGGTFGTTQTLEVAPCLYEGYVDTAINDPGQAVVSWTANQPECESVLTDGVRVSYREPRQPFENPASIPWQTLALAGGDAVSPSGQVTVSGRTTGALVSLTRMPDGSYGNREVIAENQPFEDSPTLAADTAGNLYAATETRDEVPGPEPGDDVPESQIIANFAPDGGGFGAESVLQKSYEQIDSMPVIATAGAGQAAMIWSGGTVAYLSTLQPDGSAPPPSPPATPGGSAPAPTVTAAQTGTSGGQTSSPPNAPLTSPPTTAHGSAPATTGGATGTTARPRELLVSGRLGGHTSVQVRLLRGAHLLRTAHARIINGHYRALVNVGGLPPGRYRMQILQRRGRRELMEQRWISLA
jgi:hypothetical protein